MFTDEKMEQVYQETHNIRATIEVLMATMPMEHITKQQLRQANNIWLLFSKRHPELRPDGFQRIMCKLNPGKEDLIIDLLNKLNMIGDIKGYCVLRSTEHVRGYAGDLKDLAWPHALRIIDIAVDDSGFLMMNPAGTALADVYDMNDVYTYFLCDECCGILKPPNLSFMEKYMYAAVRQQIMTKEMRKLIIITSLAYKKFTDPSLNSK